MTLSSSKIDDHSTKPSKPLWQKRFQVERLIRETLWEAGFTETRTPLLVRSPGMEPHICPIEVKRRNTSSTSAVFLPTSPEFAMKQILAKGLPRIFQICSSFRDEPESPEHHPEFTMLEIYEANTSLEAFAVRIESLFAEISSELNHSTQILFRGGTVNLAPSWPRFRIVDLFQTHLGIDLRTHQSAEQLHAVCIQHGLYTVGSQLKDSWDDLYFMLWLNLVEPKLPKDRPCFVTHYPVSQSSLCNRVKDETGFEWANRFEIYVGPLELGNAFDELRNVDLQRKNFEHDQKIRAEIYGDRYPTSPMDEEFLKAIAEMPPTCGIALGVDRMCMLLLNAETIDQILPLKSFWG